MSNAVVLRRCLIAACGMAALTAFAEPRPDCSSAALALPPRPASAPGGAEFAHRIAGLSGPARDTLITEEVRAGNLPPHLRHARAVTLSSPRAGSTARVTICVLPDYLAIGSDEDYLLVPLGLQPALSLAAEFGFALPTRRIVDAIYRQAVLRMAPRPLPASDEMRSTAYVALHNDLVRQQRMQAAIRLDELAAGHKKDLVLTPRLETTPGRVAIYGWHRADGSPIQPLSLVHGARYADYSHGVRFVSRTAWVDGVPRSLEDLLADDATADIVSDEGAMRPSIGIEAMTASTSPP